MAVTARLTEPCNTMISKDLRRKIDMEAEKRGVAMAVVVRERLEASFEQRGPYAVPTPVGASQ
jgi:hypothetical protein